MKGQYVIIDLRNMDFMKNKEGKIKRKPKTKNYRNLFKKDGRIPENSTKQTDRAC